MYLYIKSVWTISNSSAHSNYFYEQMRLFLKCVSTIFIREKFCVSYFEEVIPPMWKHFLNKMITKRTKKDNMCVVFRFKDIGRVCAAVWPASPHHWSRPSGNGGRWSRFWLLLHLMPQGRGTPCGFHGTPWSSRRGRSCHPHVDGRRPTDRPLSPCTANQCWLRERGGGMKKTGLAWLLQERI